MEESRQILEAAGLPMVEVNQTSGKAMSPGIAQLERLAVSKKLRHDGNPILAWNVSNASVKQLGGTDCILLDKRKSTGRIDGVTSLAIALAMQITAQDDFYDSPILTL